MADALLALHYQNDICHPDGRIPFSLERSTPAAEVFLSASRRALASARAKGWVIAHVHIAFADDYSDMPRHGQLFRKVLEFGAVKRGSWGAAPYEGFEPLPGEIVVTRPRNSAFYNTNLDATLRARNVDRLHIMGLATQFSVETTVRVASDLDYRIVILADCCTAADIEAHKAALKTLSFLADISTSNTI